MPRSIIALIVVVAAAAVGQRTSAQNLPFSLFERYLDSLRTQAGIPGLSASVLQDGVVAWERGFGRQDLEAAIAATPNTPYLIGDLSQTFGATLLLGKCIEEGYAELTDPIARWDNGVPSITLAHLLSHTAPGGTFRYDLTRFAELTRPIEGYIRVAYRRVLADQIFTRLGMENSVPGHALMSPTSEDRSVFTADSLARYAAVLGRLAVPYRIDGALRASRTTVSPLAATTSNGVVSSVRDLARFDAALGSGVFLDASTLQSAWTRTSDTVPTGLGWFVQTYNGQPLVWQFGLVKDAYSSLILKVPNRRLTLILLANSDGLSAPFGLERGDVTTSPFAQLFLRLHVP